MGRQEQTQLQQDTQAQQASSMQDVALMFRDQYGTILNQVERALYALHLMEESEFKFHGYSAQRMVEGRPEFIALKLALSYRNFSNYHEDMVEQYASDAAGLQKTLGEALPQTAFKANADDLMERLGKIGDDDRDKEVKQLLKQVLTNLIRDRYDRLDADLVAKIKALQNGPRVQPNPQVDQTELLNRVHNIQQNEQEIADYMSRNKGQPAPSSAYQPATRDSCLNKRSTSHYVGERGPQPQFESTQASLIVRDSAMKLGLETDFTLAAEVKQKISQDSHGKSPKELQKSEGKQMNSKPKNVESTWKSNYAKETTKQHSQNTQPNVTLHAQYKSFGNKGAELHNQIEKKALITSRLTIKTSNLPQQIPKKASEVPNLPNIPNSCKKSAVTTKQSAQFKIQKFNVANFKNVMPVSGQTQLTIKPTDTVANQSPFRTYPSHSVATLSNKTQTKLRVTKLPGTQNHAGPQKNRKGAPALR